MKANILQTFVNFLSFLFLFCWQFRLVVVVGVIAVLCATTTKAFCARINVFVVVVIR